MSEATSLLDRGDSSNYGTKKDGNGTADAIDVRRRRSSVAAMAAAKAILHDRDGSGDEAGKNPKASDDSAVTSNEGGTLNMIQGIVSQGAAVAVVSLLTFLAGIPFGSSYFPTELALPGKEVLGLRMFLFATFVGQMVFTFKSKFTNGIGLQMVENVPFYVQLGRTVIEEQGNGSGAFSTLFFLFGMSSVVVGLFFFSLGKFGMGRVVYFFPSHVLLGCIGGIGAFLAVTSVEVSTNTTFEFTAAGFNDSIVNNFHLLGPVLAFELILRLLMRMTEKNGEPQYPLLGPIYYCFITPIFYAGLFAFGISKDSAMEMGYFFPPLSSNGSVFSSDLFEIFTMVSLSEISWPAVIKSLPTLIGLAAFSLMHVPINIPAFAISTNVEPDMNAELIAHGYSNAISGLFGGLQNYMAYANSVVYAKSNGDGKYSSLSVAAVTVIVYIYGPTIASVLPRCMAGTLLLHIGVDLFREGLIESYEDYDKLEYSGVVLITVVMVLLGMEAALVAGIIAALATYAAQSVVYQDPIRGSMSGDRLRSLAWNRSLKAQEILNIKRQAIYVIQLQGHIFFGNATSMTDEIKHKLNKKREAGNEPSVVILDFQHVIGLDSSAAQSIGKLKRFLLKNYAVETLLFVTGNEDGRFRCTFNLAHAVGGGSDRASINIVSAESLSAVALATRIETKSGLLAEIPHSRMCETLDEALVFAEDILIALEDPSIFQTDPNELFPYVSRTTAPNSNEVKSLLETLCGGASSSDINTLYALLSHEKYQLGDTIWKQGDPGDSLKFVVEGLLVSTNEDEQGTPESVYPGSVIGELGLVMMSHRLSTVKVSSKEAILYSLGKDEWETLTKKNPAAARCIDMLTIKYLAHRVGHVSNDISDKRSLPV